MERKKVICLLIPTLQSGGMERVMSELAGYFTSKNSVSVNLILYGKCREVFYDIPESVHIHQPDWLFNDNKRAFHTLKTLLYVRKKVSEIAPDVVLSFGEYWNSFVLLSLLGMQIPLYISDRCSPAKVLSRPHEHLRRFLYPLASGIISQTAKARNEYKKRGYNNNIRTIANPVRSIKPDNHVIEKENIVLTVGRLISTKHHDRLIKIFRQANPGSWKLVIVGGDALKEKGMAHLKRIIENCEMEDKVILTGVVADVDAYFMKSKIFAFTSSSEGFPNVIGEAMSAGLPVISYDCVAGPSDMIDHENTGFLISLFDDNDFINKLSTLMKNESLRKSMGEAAERKIQKNSVKDIGEQVYQFITEKKENF